MPRPDAKDRQFMMYFPSTADRERWRKNATKSKMPLTGWIYSMVEAKLTEESEESRTAQAVSTLAENRHLRRELQKSEARINDLETELFKLKDQRFAADQGRASIDESLVAVLRKGGTWSNTEILGELGVDPHDIEAISLLTRQLQLLQDVKLVKESAWGWRWI
jgi:small-conductance mechanosensitive channel